jgi:hypothetical protein
VDVAFPGALQKGGEGLIARISIRNLLADGKLD